MTTETKTKTSASTQASASQNQKNFVIPTQHAANTGSIEMGKGQFLGKAEYVQIKGKEQGRERAANAARYTIKADTAWIKTDTALVQKEQAKVENKIARVILETKESDLKYTEQRKEYRAEKQSNRLQTFAYEVKLSEQEKIVARETLLAEGIAPPVIEIDLGSPAKAKKQEARK